MYVKVGQSIILIGEVAQIYKVVKRQLLEKVFSCSFKIFTD